MNLNEFSTISALLYVGTALVFLRCWLAISNTKDRVSKVAEASQPGWTGCNMLHHSWGHSDISLRILPRTDVLHHLKWASRPKPLDEMFRMFVLVKIRNPRLAVLYCRTSMYLFVLGVRFRCIECDALVACISRECTSQPIFFCPPPLRLKAMPLVLDPRDLL